MHSALKVSTQGNEQNKLDSKTTTAFEQKKRKEEKKIPQLGFNMEICSK